MKSMQRATDDAVQHSAPRYFASTAPRNRRGTTKCVPEASLFRGARPSKARCGPLDTARAVRKTRLDRLREKRSSPPPAVRDENVAAHLAPLPNEDDGAAVLTDERAGLFDVEIGGLGAIGHPLARVGREVVGRVVDRRGDDGAVSHGAPDEA